ncbi:MAG: hypothetical protein ACLP3B_07765 [Syntrophobacteraceae bacterium]
MKKILLLFLWFCLTPGIANAATYWVHPTDNTATWNTSGCESSTDPGSGHYCSLSTAVASAVAGDVVNLEQGSTDYTSGMNFWRVHSGTAGNMITFQNAPGQSPVVTNTTSAPGDYYISLWMSGQSYTKISGITFVQSSGLNYSSGNFQIEASSNHNEIANCTFDGSFSGSDPQLSDGNGYADCSGGVCSQSVTNNYIHGCTFKNSAGGGCLGSCSGSADCTCSSYSCSCPQATSVTCTSTSCTVVDPNGTSTCIGSANWGGGLQVGTFVSYTLLADSTSNYNTVDENTFYCGGHHDLEVYSRFNVIRNNYFHNDGCASTSVFHPATINGNSITCGYNPDYNGLWGGRNVQIPYGMENEDMYDLNEGNRYGASGAPPDTDGGDGLTISGGGAIHRYNVITSAQNNGIMVKAGSENIYDNRIYNNTVYDSARWQNETHQQSGWEGANFRFYEGGPYEVGNVVKNNIFYGYGPGSSGTAGVYTGVTPATGEDWWNVGSSNVDTSGVENSSNTGRSATKNLIYNNLCTVKDSLGMCSIYGQNPDFVSPDTSWADALNNPALPNLALQSGSPAINTGTSLTQTNGSGTNSTTLVVNDAMYFQDGSWGSDLARGVNFFPDWIAIGTVNNVVQIAEGGINYSTNTITLASPMTWSNGAPIWLYKKSDGTRVLYGSESDIGAIPYSSGSTTFTVTPSFGANGTIHPSTPQTVNSGSATQFTVTPSLGYSASVGGTCGGSLAGSTYTTNSITGDCTVAATFSPIGFYGFSAGWFGGM